MKVTLVLCALALTSCAAVKERYRKQHHLVHQRADCESEERKFWIEGLAEDEAEVNECASDCEGISVGTYRVGERRRETELYLTNYVGHTIIRLDFEKNTYQIVEVTGGEPKIEKGSCRFTPL